jgi:hypothetical protein
MAEIAAFGGDLATEMLAATFAGELVGDIRRDAADRGLERPFGFVVQMLRDRWLGLDRGFAIDGLLGH